MIKRTIASIIGLALICMSAGAQSFTIKKNGENISGNSTKLQRESMIGTTMDSKNLPLTDQRFSDDKLKDLEKQMKERAWSSEDTAWERACIMDNIDGYKRYVAMYPQGKHRVEADKRLVDLEVEDVFRNAHNRLPGLKKVEDDEDSPTSTIIIHNRTGYRLTVMYSGEESKSIVIGVGAQGVVTIPNGEFKIAASVPPGDIRPFAGTGSFDGGTYECSFYVVSGY